MLEYVWEERVRESNGCDVNKMFFFLPFDWKEDIYIYMTERIVKRIFEKSLKDKRIISATTARHVPQLTVFKVVNVDFWWRLADNNWR